MVESIAFLSYYSGVSKRGVETFVHELANRLSRWTIVDVYQSGPKLPHALYNVLPLQSPSELPKLSLNTKVVIPLNGRVQALKAKIWCVRNHKKIVIPGQSGLGADDKWNLLLMPNWFVALTKTQASWAKKFNPFSNIVIIPNGVDTQIFNPIDKKYQCTLKRPRCLWVGAFSPEKHPELAVRVLSLLPEHSLLMVGDGVLKKEILNLCEELIPNRYKIISMPHNQIPQVYRSADYLLFTPQPYESFGIVTIESMASGVPVVSTPDAIRSEIISSFGGILAKDRTPEGLRDAINLAIKIDRTKVRQQGLLYDWEEIARKYKQLFEL